MSRITDQTRQRARDLRRGQTFQERALLSHRLVIEIDGDSHGAPGQSRHDATRDQWLASQGFTVWRFSARDIEHNLEGVVETILLCLGLFGPEND